MIWNLCIRRPVTTIVVFLILGIFGIYGYTQMPVQENPEVEFPVISVSIVLSGAAPETVEMELIEPLEEEINTIEGLKELDSTAREQVGSIVANFELWRDQDLAAQDVRDAVERAKRELPEDAESPVVRKLEMDSSAIMWIALQGDERWDDVRMTEYADQNLKPQLETMRGVGQIQIGGSQDYAVRVRIDPQRLAAHGLTMQDVVGRIQQENVDIPSGRVEGISREFLIRTQGMFSEAAPFNDLVLAYRDGIFIRLSDVGEAVDSTESDRQLARFAGEPTIGLGVVKQTGANTVQLADNARSRIKELSQDFPPGLDYKIAHDGSEYIEENIGDLQTTIMIAASLVILVILAFLRSGRGTVVVALAIPTSLLIGLAVINVLGFTINVLTLLALILVIGIVVDDAIVVLERNYLHMERGAEAVPAARVGTTEVAFPTIANSLSLGAVFIPVAFTGGVIGRFFFEFGLTVAFTVFASTLVALSLSPMLCSRILKYKPRKSYLYQLSENFFKGMENAYAWILSRALNRRVLVVTIGLLAFGLGIAAFLDIPKEFQPDTDRASFMLIFETPEGSTIRESDQLARKIEEILAQDERIMHQFLAIGLARGGTPGQPDQGLAFVTLTPRQEREKHQTELMQIFREKFAQIPEGRVFVTESDSGDLGGDPVEVVLQNPDLKELDRLQQQVMGWMRDRSDLFVGVRSNLELNKPQVEVNILRDKAAEMNVSVADISQTLRYLFGEVDISQVERQAERYDVLTDVIGRGEITPELLRSVYVRNSQQQMVSLDNLVDIQEIIGPSEIHHYDRLRSSTISAATPPGVALGDAVGQLEEYLQQEMPAGADYELAGMSQLFEESFYYLTITIIFSIIFIYLVLSAQFESFILPLTIMTALPLATVGAFGSLWLLDMNFSVLAFIGLIMLMGLVTKNSILLVDYINVLIARGKPPGQAALEAGRERFRPVLMTAISTILGMTPIALGYGAGGEARAPLGVAVLAGLFSATALTLIVVPVVYTLFNQLQEFILGRGKRS
ncbi:MAG: efflux RND transporter permease subunit [Thermodesulfobacteriota bacterium]